MDLKFFLTKFFWAIIFFDLKFFGTLIIWSLIFWTNNFWTHIFMDQNFLFDFIFFWDPPNFFFGPNFFLRIYQYSKFVFHQIPHLLLPSPAPTSTWVEISINFVSVHQPTGLVVVTFNFNSKFNSINQNF